MSSPDRVQRPFFPVAMTWSTRFRIRYQVLESLWLVPIAGAFAGGLMALASLWLGGVINLPARWTFPASTSQSVLTTIAGATISLVGFVLTVTVLLVQAANGTLSARYLRFVYGERMLKTALAFLVGTFTCSFVLLRHVDDPAVGFGVELSILFVLAGIAIFLAFLSRLLHRLRPAVLAALTGRLGERVFMAGMTAAQVRGPEVSQPSGREGDLVASTRCGMIQALDLKGLVGWAERHACLLVFRHGVSDFVSPQTPLVEVRGARVNAAAARQIEGMVALGKERTTEQDPAFAIRLMVDIATRALSPGNNDPTTAVQVLDYLENLLLVVGRTDLSARGMYRDAGGTPRLIIPERTWESFLSLAVSEIRVFGGSSLQVVRRLRVLLQRLRASVREEHRPAVDSELARLDATVQRFFGHSSDLDLAMAADLQGIGGFGAPCAAAVTGNEGKGRQDAE